jgi:hypothetical protein
MTLMQWMYSVRWTLRHLPCPGEKELIRMIVPAGAVAAGGAGGTHVQQWLCSLHRFFV